MDFLGMLDFSGAEFWSKFLRDILLAVCSCMIYKWMILHKINVKNPAVKRHYIFSIIGFAVFYTATRQLVELLPYSATVGVATIRIVFSIIVFSFLMYRLYRHSNKTHGVIQYKPHQVGIHSTIMCLMAFCLALIVWYVALGLSLVILSIISHLLLSSLAALGFSLALFFAIPISIIFYILIYRFFNTMQKSYDGDRKIKTDTRKLIANSLSMRSVFVFASFCVIAIYFGMRAFTDFNQIAQYFYLVTFFALFAFIAFTVLPLASIGFGQYRECVGEAKGLAEGLFEEQVEMIAGDMPQYEQKAKDIYYNNMNKYIMRFTDLPLQPSTSAAIVANFV